MHYKLYYKYFSLLSLDVVLGAIVSSGFFSLMLEAKINVLILIVLGLVVWAIYTFDHLVDSQVITTLKITERHLFHQINHSVLSKWLVCDLLLVLGLLFFLPTKTIIIGAVLGLFVVIYFLTIRLLKWNKVYHKELMIGFAYFAGILVAPLSAESIFIDIENIFLLTPMFFLVMANLLLFSLHDSYFDKRSKFPSVVQALGVSKSSIIIDGLGILIVFNLIFLVVQSEFLVTVIYGVMFVMLVIISKLKHHYFVDQNYRYIGDAIFIVPVFYFLV